MDLTLLRRALLANAGFSGLSGLALLLAAAPLGQWIGVGQPWILRAIGSSLLLFAAVLVLLARADEPDRAPVIAVSGSDFAWVLGSIVLVAAFPEQLTVEGRWAVAAVALVVGGLGAAQLAGLRRYRRPARS